LETSKGQLEKIKNLLPEAVKSAKQVYDLKIQGDLEDEMEDKLERYQKKLNDWLGESERQMEIKFGGEELGGSSFHKKKRKSEVNYVKNQMDAFYNEYFQLENEPFLRVLAVFYNA